ncbi:MAG: hypothetical protein KAH01_02020 [Caldisericia bacterium]|nr:hypothetical protein [Caldisericia bacterium]
MLLDYKQVVEMILKVYFEDISMYRTVFLKNIVNTRMEDVNSHTISEYCRYIEQSYQEGLLLLKALRNTHSLFFRDQITYCLLDNNVIPKLIKKAISSKNSEIRVWSMACSAGQEPYSVAMLLDEHVSKCENNISYRIFATDMSIDQLKKAEKGVYNSDELMYTNLSRVQKNFTEKNGRYTISTACKRFVSFSQFDLLNRRATCSPESIYSDFDLVFCCNVLFYYTPEYQKIILAKAVKSLSDKGVLVIGEAEKKILLDNYQMRSIDSSSLVFAKESMK